MEQRIKLRPKQLAILQEIAARRQQLNAIHNDISNQEAVIVDLVLEENGIKEPGTVNIEGDTLVYTEKAKAATNKGKGKTKKLEPVK